MREHAETQPPHYTTRANVPLNGYYELLFEQSHPNSDEQSVFPYLSETGHYQKGIKQGQWGMHFYANTEDLDYSATYKDGILDGPFVVYNLNRTVRYQVNFMQGNGLWKTFYPTGQLKSMGSYQNGREHGVWLEYRADGSVKERTTYEHGVVQHR